MKNIGLIVNPIAGMGGRVGLKGTDGFNIQQQAISLGATSEAKYRAFETLNVLSSSSSIFKLTTCSREMGEYPALKAGFKPELVYSMASGPSTANDTRIAASKMQEIGVDLLLFVGGDGTARDICDEIGEDILTLGVPSGVKIQSGVFAVTPKSAGHIVRSFIDGEITETYLRKVIDVDESNLNNDVICSTHYGFLKLPQDIATPLIVGIFSASLIYFFIPEDYFMSIGTGILGMLIMLLIGLPSYICATASVPIALALHIKGFSMGALIVFLMSGPATNIATISVAIKQIGKKSTIIYLFSIVLCSVIAGLCFDFFFPGLQVEETLSPHMHIGSSLFNQISGAILIGILINSYIQSYLSSKKSNLVIGA